MAFRVWKDYASTLGTPEDGTNNSCLGSLCFFNLIRWKDKKNQVIPAMLFMHLIKMVQMTLKFLVRKSFTLVKKILYFLLLFFYWRIIALPCCVSFCSTTRVFSDKGIHVSLYHIILYVLILFQHSPKQKRLEYL